jgi:hypothetical protein
VGGAQPDLEVAFSICSREEEANHRMVAEKGNDHLIVRMQIVAGARLALWSGIR